MMNAPPPLATFFSWALLVLIASLPRLAAAESEEEALLPYEASYRATLEKGIPFNGSATRSLALQDDGSWLYTFKVESFIADITETSRLNWIEGQAKPSTYRYALEGMMIRDRTRSINLNWADQHATGHYEDRDIDLSVPATAQDPLSYQLQLQQDIRLGKQTMHYQVIDKNRIEEDTFAVLGEETLNGEFGSVNTIKVEKVREEEAKRTTLMWFAPEWDYLLVRLLQIEKDGTRYEIHLESARVNGEPIQLPPKS
ncbi:DUF3108 domain-containing protein [Marinobacter bohaiensis]|uniref:DUF3108 domain-containing protein n=1 Tax=Marinobacter bohaiensis TaxID=2201898 RepID=UPI000DAD5FEF|nr:DUF3108 domain-containing protein [Marinobacter bohaiensis]